MPKKRMICESLLYSEDFNSLTIAEQNIYFRLLSIADDLGVTPANGYALNKILNPPEGTDVVKSLKKFDQKLGHIFTYGDKEYFCFNPITFWEIQKGVVAKRTRSEYLLISPNEFFSKKFLEDSGISRKFPEILSRLKDKVYSMKIKGLKDGEGMQGERKKIHPLYQVFVDKWCVEYQTRLKAPYIFNGAIDGKAVNKLLTIVKDNVTVDDVLSVAYEAWENPDGFWCKQAVTIAGFASKFNNIFNEIKNEFNPETKAVRLVLRGGGV